MEDDSNTLDLHGLHVKEALEVMERFLELKLHSRKYPSVYIISGTGHHSGPQSRSKARYSSSDSSHAPALNSIRNLHVICCCCCCVSCIINHECTLAVFTLLTGCRLLPAVQDFLESYGYDFITCSKDGRGGCFQVCIGRSEDHLT